MYGHRQRRPQSGSSLFEVLVSLLILGLGVLGVVAVQTAALRNTVSSLEFGQAARQGQAMLDAMRSRRFVALAGGYHTGGLVCDVQTGGVSDIRRWLEDVQEALGETACGEIVCQAGAEWCRVTIRWGETFVGTGESVAHELTTGTRL